MRALSTAIPVVLILATVAAATPPPQRVAVPPPPTPQPKPSVPFVHLTPPGPPQLDPSQIDFSPLWSGESAHKTVVFTVAAAGMVSATPLQPPFSIVAMRVFLPGQKTTGGKAVGGQPTAQPAAYNLSQRISPPWQMSCAAGDEVQIEVAFAPVFDLFKMAAGEKSGTIQLQGPAWNATLPVTGMFKGVQLVPLMQVVDPDRAVEVSPTTASQAPFVLQFVSTGQPFNATVKSCETSRYSLRGSQFDVAVPAGGTAKLAMWMVVKPATCCKLDSPPATIEASYTQGTTKGTLSAPIHWTLVPVPFTWSNFSGGCHGVSFGGTLTLNSNGSVTFNGKLWSIYTEPQTEMLQLTFSGVSKPVWSGEVTASPMSAQQGGGGNLYVGPPSSQPSTAFLNAVKGGPALGCGK